jgi:hypothetical protein
MWEYKVEEILLTGRQLEMKLNIIGDNGWELVHVNNNTTYIFKRNTQVRNTIIKKK